LCFPVFLPDQLQRHVRVRLHLPVDRREVYFRPPLWGPTGLGREE
jgi:hypothetical protein